MTQILDQTSRPAGHPTPCYCSTCRALGPTTPNQPALDDAQRGLDGAATSERLAHLEAQAKSTHSWVVVIGWIVVIQATLAICLGAAAGYRAHQADMKTKARAACVQAGGAIADCLAAY